MINEKSKKIITYVGASVAVYIVLKYILPLGAPFIVAFFFSMLLNPVVTFMNKRLNFKRSIATVMVMLFAGVLIGGALWYLGRVLTLQIRNVVENYNYYYDTVNLRMCDICDKLDTGLGFKGGTTINYINNMLLVLSDAATEKLMPAIMGKSFSAFKWMVSIGGVFVIFYMSVFFITKDYHKLKDMVKEKTEAQETGFLLKRVGHVVTTYLKTQLIIIGVTTVICAIGFLFMKNSYWLLLSILIGLVDALPIFGTGTILLPWAIITALAGNYLNALVILSIYIICYFSREYLEPKLMGKDLGIHPLFMLMAAYVGLVLFGIAGVITGPIAVMLIKEIIIYYNDL